MSDEPLRDGQRLGWWARIRARMPAWSRPGAVGPDQRSGDARAPSSAPGPHKASERRREVRVEVELRVALRFESAQDIVHSQTVNLSEGGMFIRTRSPRLEGTHVLIHLDVAGREVELSGVVAHRVSVAEAGQQPPGMGIAFLQLSEEARAFVDELLERAQR